MKLLIGAITFWDFCFSNTSEVDEDASLALDLFSGDTFQFALMVLAVLASPNSCG